MEVEVARVTPVWVVWWEDPDRSWESICMNLAEFEKEYEARQADHVIKHWGKVGKRDRQSLLEWLECHLRVVPASCANDFVNPAKEILRRVSVSGSGPVIVRTW
jgi:hypothetical protein